MKLKNVISDCIFLYIGVGCLVWPIAKHINMPILDSWLMINGAVILLQEILYKIRK